MRASLRCPSKPLDLYGLRQEMSELVVGDEGKMRTALDLFARYLNIVVEDVTDQKQYQEPWDFDRMRGLLYSLANDLEGRRYSRFCTAGK